MTYTNMILSPVGFYENMKAKTKKEIQNYTYFNLLFNILLSMFEYSGFDTEKFDTFDTRYIDAILCSTGSIACGMLDNKLTFAPCTLGGDIDAYGLGTEVIAPTPKGDIKGVRNKEVAYGINNKLASPDTLLYWVSSIMSELDVSAKSNILYSRLLKIPVVNDEKSKNAIMDIYKKLVNGEDLTALVSSNVFDDLLEKDITTIELTDENKIDRIQYISRFYDDVLKRFSNFYGQALQTQNKSAQTQSDELHGMDSFSFIIPLQMLECRRELVDNINNIFDTNIEVNFSDSWKYELARFETRDLNDNGVADVDELDAEETSETIETTDKIQSDIDNEEKVLLDITDLSQADRDTITDMIKELI